MGEASLSRNMADLLVGQLDLGLYIHQLETTSPNGHGMDELFFSTLNVNPILRIPGGFTRACVDRGHRTYGITV